MDSLAVICFNFNEYTAKALARLHQTRRPCVSILRALFCLDLSRGRCDELDARCGASDCQPGRTVVPSLANEFAKRRRVGVLRQPTTLQISVFTRPKPGSSPRRNCKGTGRFSSPLPKFRRHPPPLQRFAPPLQKKVPVC